MKRRLRIAWTLDGLKAQEFLKVRGLWESARTWDVEWSTKKTWTPFRDPLEEKDSIVSALDPQKFANIPVILILPREEVVAQKISDTKDPVLMEKRAADFFPWPLQDVWWNVSPHCSMFGISKKRAQQFENCFKSLGLPLFAIACSESFSPQINTMKKDSSIAWLVPPQSTAVGQKQKRIQLLKNRLAVASVAFVLLSSLANWDTANRKQTQLHQKRISESRQHHPRKVVSLIEQIGRAMPASCQLTEYRYVEEMQTVVIRGTAPSYAHADEFFDNLKTRSEWKSLEAQKASLDPVSNRVEFSGEIIL